MGERHRLEEPAHAARRNRRKTSERGVDLSGAGVFKAGLELGGPSVDAQATEKLALPDRPMHARAGAAHAGWKGAFTGIIEATVGAMERLGAARGRIVAALGPLIRQPSYEVSADFVARFAAADPANQRFFAPATRAGHALFDLPGYIAMRATRAGIAALEDLECCTYADPARFFSYRRSTHQAEADYGRHVNAIAIVE